ncbi:MAG TPA: hypothetical protein VGQ76_07040 [Thermoanaerobaculia bacterium]|jgi:hypothetical protein|nr:hypothetical protein [Thermoanaerobaculia bacterium]
MFVYARSVFTALLLSGALLHAQSSPDVSGHWDGVIQAPQMDVAIAVDLARDATGALTGTFDSPARQVRAFPLANITASGTSVAFEIKANGGGTFRGTITPDGKSVSGTFAMAGPDGQSMEIPFQLTRTRDAVVEAAPKSPAIAKNLEGKWTGTIVVEETQKPIELHLSNHADGTSTGVLKTNDGVEVPIWRIAQTESGVRLEVRMVGGSWEGKLEGDALVGTWTQGAFTAPLTFRRSVRCGELTWRDPSSEGSFSRTKDP